MEKTIEELQAEVLAAAGELSALIGGSIGAALGAWQIGDIQTSGQVTGKMAWVQSNVSAPDRNALMSALAELLACLENSN